MTFPTTILNPHKKHDFVILYDVTDGNVNGDPDAGNLPRIDNQTLNGLATDVSLKRRIRNFVQIVRGDDEFSQIYVKQRGILANEQKKAYDALGIKPGKAKGEDSESKKESLAAKWLCEHYFDIRMFGAVLGVSEYKAGQVLGPVQITFSRTIDPIVQRDIAITRVAQTNAERDKKSGEVLDEESARFGQMGRKAITHYGLYRASGFFTPAYAKLTGVTEADLELFWDALLRMWEFDRTATRGYVATRKVVVFTHESEYGNAPAHKLLESVKVTKKDGVKIPRSIDDYNISIDELTYPNVTVTVL